MKKVIFVVLVFVIPFLVKAQGEQVSTEVLWKDSTTYVKTVVTSEAAVTSKQVLEMIGKLEEEIVKAQQQLKALENRKTELLKIVGMIEQEERKNGKG